MKIFIKTNAPTILIDAIRKAVVENELKTWVIVKDNSGEEFITHRPEQWFEKALLDFTETPGNLVVDIAWYRNAEPGNNIKGYYIGRFTEVLLVHFSEYFSHLEVYPA